MHGTTMKITKFILYVMCEHPVVLCHQVKDTIKHDCSLLKKYFAFNKLHVLTQIVRYQPLYKNRYIFIQTLICPIMAKTCGILTTLYCFSVNCSYVWQCSKLISIHLFQA
jgi:hypothetical protein